MLIISVLGCVIALVQCITVEAIECYICTNTSSIPDCTNTITCPTDAVCASEYTTIHGTRVYNLGCKDLLTCPLTPTVSPGAPYIIGRSAKTPVNCSECCHSNYCNRNTCQDVDPQCADDKTFNCATVGAITNICADASHIRPYCRRFCGFCNTVDGGWSHWSQWSLCSVTCGNGTRARSRTCSDPVPSNGGSDCPGVTHEQEPCLKDLCPVHGGWSSWSEWGSCSTSCDIGLQRRDRTCSKPYPARSGEHCYGESRDDKLCLPGACANGSWSSWGAWGTCTATCGSGVTTRGRICDNPAPSVTGAYCTGDSSESKTCDNPLCNGGSWSSWGTWGACTTSCGGGVKIRSRSCATMTGRYCAGDPIQAGSCSTSPCHVIGFSVTRPKMSPTSGQLTFTTVITNMGNNYNLNTGVFTCGTPGYYFFFTSLQKKDGHDGAAECYVRKNGKNLIQAFTVPGVSPHRGYTNAVAGIYVHLVTGDKVTLGGCSSISSFETDDTSSFSGLLLTPDDV